MHHINLYTHVFGLYIYSPKYAINRTIESELSIIKGRKEIFKKSSDLHFFQDWFKLYKVLIFYQNLTRTKGETFQ